MNKIITNFGRIDKAIADNSNAIKDNFGEQASLVQDFIIFILKNIKTNLFGFTEFTLAEFCKATGNTRQQMAIIDPIFSKPGSKIKPPIKSGITFSTVFDYGLYSMMQKNIILDNNYPTKKGETIVQLKSIGIISDINILIGAKGIKKYQIRVSPDLLEGFASRYYSVDTDAYRLLGKGKKSIMRKAFLIYLCKIRHILFSNKKNETTISVDVLAAEAGIQTKENYHTKRSLSRILDKIQEIGFPFNYEYQSINKNSAQYYVKLTFDEVYPKSTTKEHLFFYAIIDDFSSYFQSTYGNRQFKDKEPFQRWLTNIQYNTDVKIGILKKLYKKFFEKNLSDQEAINIMTNGFYESTYHEEEINDFDFQP